MTLHTQLPIYKVAYGLFDVIMDLAKNMPRDFPAQFEALASVQELIGPIAYLFRNRKTGERYSLRALPPNKGRYQDDPDDRVEGRDAASSRRVPSHDGLAGIFNYGENNDN